MPKLVLFLYLCMLLSLPAFHTFEHFKEAACQSDRRAQHADLHLIVTALSASLPSQWSEADVGPIITISRTAITARAEFLGPSGTAMIRIAAYRGSVARYFVRIGMGSQANDTMTIGKRRFKSFIARNGTLYVMIRNAVVIAISGTACDADKTLLASRLDPGSLASLVNVTVSPTVGTLAC